MRISRQMLILLGGGTITSTENSVDLMSIAENLVMENGKTQPYNRMNARTAMMMGVYEMNWGKKKKGNIPSDGDRSQYSQEKYKFFLNAPFEISNRCCNVMKKSPAHRYHKDTGRCPMTAQMASESRLRTQQWIRNGCNGFNLKIPTSNPMAFWTEQDVLLYIKQHNIPICSVYGDIVVDYNRENQVEGQMDFFDWDKTAEESELFDLDRPLLKTTGCDRTGCMFCGYGAHCKGDTRFVDMKETHPTQYKWIMKPWDEGGLGYKEVIDWINEHGNLNIKY